MFPFPLGAPHPGHRLLLYAGCRGWSRSTVGAGVSSLSGKTLIPLLVLWCWSGTHFACAFDWRNYEYTKKPFEFSNSEEGFQVFKTRMEELSMKHGKTAVIPGIEPTGHYWFALGKFLQDKGWSRCMWIPIMWKSRRNWMQTGCGRCKSDLERSKAERCRGEEANRKSVRIKQRMSR